MVNMTVAEFISALGSSVTTITYDTTQAEGVTLSEDGLTANIYNVAISGEFSSSSQMPTTLVTADLSGLNTSNITNMNSMFGGCISLTSLDLSSFDTSSVTDMSGMFTHCSKLTSLDLSGFDTSNVTNMSGMFSNCLSLTSLNISNFNTSNVTNMRSMFGNCSLASLDLSNFNTSKVTNMMYMFYGCSLLTALNISNFDTSKVTDMAWMFSGCNSLTFLDLSNFDTSKVSGEYELSEGIFSGDTISKIIIDPDKWTLSKSKTAFYATELHFFKNGDAIKADDFITTSGISLLSKPSILVVDTLPATFGSNVYIKRWAPAADFTTASWEDIKDTLEAHYSGDIDIADYWGIGDVKKDISLSAIDGSSLSLENQDAQNIDLVIVGIKHDDLADGSGKAAITLAQNNCLATTGVMNSNYNSYTYARWSTGPRRTWIQNAYYNALPTDLSSMIKEVTKLSAYPSDSSNTQALDTTTEKCFFPSNYELFGSTYSSYVTVVDGTQYSYYATQSNRIKCLGQSSTSTDYWWSRSGSYSYESSSARFVLCDDVGGQRDYRADNALGICPHFCL